MKRTFVGLLVVLSLVSIISLGAVPVMAGEGARAPSSLSEFLSVREKVMEAPPVGHRENSGTAALRMDEVVVTAQKRAENVQDVPIVVTAISRQLLQDTGVRDIKDLTFLTPGLTVTSTANETSTTARIRGVGTVGDNIGLESSVGIVIDEVYRPRNGVGFGDLGELERIEVLKGPQGTLFGKNTSAGVINVRTAYPRSEPRTRVTVFGGTYDTPGHAPAKWWDANSPGFTGANFFHSRQIGQLDLVLGGNAASAMISGTGASASVSKTCSKRSWRKYRRQKATGMRR